LKPQETTVPSILNRKLAVIPQKKGLKSSEPKVKAYVPMYEPLMVEKCKKCKTILAEPKKLIRIVKTIEK
jgi:hypothetical protein